MVVALVARQVAVGEDVGLRVAGDAHAGEVAAVVGGLAVGEPVGDGEVEDLVHERVAHRVAHEGGVVDRLRRDHADLQHVGDVVVAERHDVARARHGEGDVGAVPHAAGPVVLVPGLVDRDLGRVVARRQRVGREAADPVAVGVLQPGPQARRVPVGRAAELALEAAGHGRDDRVRVVGDPVRPAVVEERDRGGGRQLDHDVGPVPHGAGAVVLVPGAVEGGLVLPGAGGQGEARLPHAVVGAGGELGGGTVGLPVAGAAQLLLEAAGDGDRGSLRARAGHRPGCAGGGRHQSEDRGDDDRSAPHETSPRIGAGRRGKLRERRVAPVTEGLSRRPPRALRRSNVAETGTNERRKAAVGPRLRPAVTPRGRRRRRRPRPRRGRPTPAARRWRTRPRRCPRGGRRSRRTGPGPSPSCSRRVPRCRPRPT